MSLEEEKSRFYELLVKLITAELNKQKKPAKQVKKDLGVLNKSLKANRLLPGAKMVRSGRPLTDYSAKIKKAQRRAVKGEAIKYRKAVKGAKKALINSARSTAKSAYKK